MRFWNNTYHTIIHLMIFFQFQAETACPISPSPHHIFFTSSSSRLQTNVPVSELNNDNFSTWVLSNYVKQEAMENLVFPDKCSFMLIAMTKSLNKSTVDQQTLQSLWGCLGDNHWAQSVLRSLSIDRQIKTYQIFHIWDSRLGPKASFMKGVERGILNIANYSIVRLD